MIANRQQHSSMFSLNALIGTLITIEDIKRKAKRKEDFTAGMIHDIRNPLASMICCLDFIKENDEIQEDENIANMLEIASDCAEFIMSHVGNFMDISKIETNKLELQVSDTDIIELVRKIVCMHKFKAENKNLFLKLNATNNIPELAKIDIGRFTQVLVNLISNAIKYTGSGGVTVNIYFKDLLSPILSGVNGQGGRGY